MKRIVEMSMEGDTLLLRMRVYVDDRCGRGRELIRDGAARLVAQGPYATELGFVYARVQLCFVERFSFDAVNVRVQDVPLRRLHGLLRIFNTVSRTYFGAAFRGIFKLNRFLLRMPDVFINLAGRSLDEPVEYAVQCSIVEHELAHVWGCRDQYIYRNDNKRRANVADNDLMYRTGIRQRLQGYHIEGLCRCARRGKLPWKWI